jgi:ferritin
MKDKIKEAFEEFWGGGKFLEVVQSYEKNYVAEKIWQACAEWMLSQASEEFNDWLDSLSKEELEDIKYFSAFRGWYAARLSSAKEIAEKDARINNLESELRLIYCRYSPAYNREQFSATYPLASELASKKEST